ncbi:hypothetical protein [Spirosoma sp. KNUC1025]|uniref:hypothetical protein n=1 Tax=Spirosoma sp. KNUC1025 TaxID=2894082 RepID=UPI00386CECA2|nr:hypothetical protein LN737_01630 [Spirosoma sp. KNUC1025]
MNEQAILQDVANKLIERWKIVMMEGQKANEAQNEVKISIYRQERHFLEKLIDEIRAQLPGGLPEWETYRQHPAPPIYFSPDSTDVEPRF